MAAAWTLADDAGAVVVTARPLGRPPTHDRDDVAGPHRVARVTRSS